MEYLFPIFVGVIGMLLGIKIGIERLANDLYSQNRLHPDEHTYITSMKYFKDCFKLK